MTVSRISVAALAVLLSAFGALAQQGDRGATAPPRQLGGPQTASDRPPEVSTNGLRDDSVQASSDSKATAPQKSRDEPPEVSTEGLIDDYEDDEPAERPGASGVHSRASSSPDEGLGSDTMDSASVRRGDIDAAPLAPVSGAVPLNGPIVAKPEGVQVETLGTVDGSTAGLLDSGNGGLEGNIWVGSSRDQVDELLSKIPLASTDSAVHGLARRVILTKADSPSGSYTRAFATIRIQKLLDAGMVDDAGAMAAQAQAKDDADFARVQANALLLAGRKEVCGQQTAARTTLSDPFWLELRAYCAAVSGDTATADLTRDVMTAQGISDSAFNTLVGDVLSKARKPVLKIAKPTPLHIYLLRKAGLPIPADIAKQPGPVVNVLIMRDPKSSPEMRLAAAERALRIGGATAAELKSVADAQVFSPAQISAALANAPKLSFLQGQALLRRAAQLEGRSQQKAALVHEALTLGDKAGLFEAASELQADVAASIDVKGVAQDEGPLIGWSLLLAGKTAAAAPWLGDNDVARAVLGLVSGKDDTAQAALSNIATRMLKNTDKPPRASGPMEALLLGLYDALGRTMPGDAKAEAAALGAQHMPGRRPDDAAMQKMLLASATPERKGEAILRILDIVGIKGPGDLAPDITIEIARALVAMNLRDSARSFAIHALMLYRPGTA
jgi:hypothetical protein